MWMWKIFKYTDAEIFESCGMSAIVYLRFLRLGLKLSAWGVFNSIYLIPVNMYGCRDETDACSTLSGAFDRASIGNVSAQNPSLIATTLAAYIIFGKAMYYIFHEFQWFTEWRHKYCIKPRPDNYTVYVAHIPKRFRSDVALLEYFRSIFSYDDVLQAKIALDINSLDKKVASRKKTVEKLEHAINIKNVKGYEPRHWTALGDYLYSIPTFETELEKLNEEISSVITQIEEAKSNEKRKFLRDMLNANGHDCSTGDLSNNSDHRLTGPNYSGVSKGSRKLTTYESASESDDEFGTVPKTIEELTEEDDFYISTSRTDSSHEVNCLLSPAGFNSTYDAKTPPKTNVGSLTNDTIDADTPRKTHVKSPTNDTIDTLTLPPDENRPFIGADADADVSIDTSVFNEGSVMPHNMKGPKHRRNVTFGSIGSVITTKTIGSAKKSIKAVGRSVESVGKTVGHAGRNVRKSVDHVGKLGKTMAGRVNQSAVVIKNVAGRTVNQTVVNVKDLAVQSAQIATKASSRMTRLLFNADDGEVLDSGFVTFANLSSKAQCVQIVHHASPFKFHVLDAPLPKDVIWSNVGVSHKELQLAYLIAQFATVALMVFWTFPVAFFTSLSEADSLKDLIPTLESVIEENPWVAKLLAQLSPILLVTLTAILPVILSIVCRYEGHIGQNDLNASLLSKLSYFMIIQIFFVQVISGSVFDRLSEMLKDSSLIVNLLATSVPTQVKSFIQFVLVQMFIGCSIELLRVVRVAMAFFRKKVGPNLTPKESNAPFLFLLPITTPEDMEYPMLYAEMVLYFMVNMVYSCIAPIMSCKSIFK